MAIKLAKFMPLGWSLCHRSREQTEAIHPVGVVTFLPPSLPGFDLLMERHVDFCGLFWIMKIFPTLEGTETDG